MRVELRHLQVLVAIEEEGSGRAAARRLDLSERAVARTLARLEEHLGYPVFRTEDGRAVATARGRTVLDHARRAVRGVEDLTRTARRAHVLRLAHHGVPVTAVLGALATARPDVAVQLAVAEPEEAHRLLEQGRIDVFAGAWPPHVAWPAPGVLARVHALTEPLAVHLPPGHPLAGRAGLELSDLAGQPFAVLPGPARAAVRAECLAVGGFEPDLRLETGDRDGLAQLVGGGWGVAIAPGRLTGPAVRREYPGASGVRRTVVHHPERVAPGYVRAVVAALRATGQDT